MSENFSVSNGLQINQFVNNLKASNNNLNKKSKTQSNFLNKKVENKTANKNKIENKSNSSSKAGQIILAKKGQAGYMREFDLNDDGKISLEEFNEYCEQNGIDGRDKLRLLTVMQSASANEKATEKIQEKSEKDSKETDNKMLYAKKGDEKYDKAIDENQNGEITYAEYFKYLQEHDKTSEKQAEENQNDTTSQAQTEFDDELEEYIPKEIAPETQSTVEYEG